eukprot:scaffold875_cov185-Amphora_coffeaeformis.AAC.21
MALAVAAAWFEGPPLALAAAETVKATTATIAVTADGGTPAPLDNVHDNEQQPLVQNETATMTTAVGTQSVGTGTKNRNTISDGVVHELGLDNFYKVIGESSYTVVLFYDPHVLTKKADSSLHKKQLMLRRLARDFANMAQPTSFLVKNLRIHFAQIDVRKHNFIRRTYVRWGGSSEGSRYIDYFRDYSDLDEVDSSIPEDGMVNSTTFMTKHNKHLPSMRTEWTLFQGSDFDIANCIDKAEKIDGEVVDTLDYDMVLAWFVQEIQDDLMYNMQGRNAPRLPFAESEEGPEAAIRSYINTEKHLRKNYEESDPMASIDWEKVKSLAAGGDQNENCVATEEEVGNSSSSNNNKDQTAVASSFAKETYQIHHDDQGDAFFKYKLDQKVKINDALVLSELTDLIDFYLARANSYENLWSPERRAAEDTRTNYGSLLKQMDAKLTEVLFSTYHDLRNSTQQDDEENGFALISEVGVPKLEAYFDQMLFGYGRSSTRLEEYLRKNIPWDGSMPSDKTRDEDLKGLADLELFERIRDYMRVREEVGDSVKYSFFLRSLWIQFHAIVSEFQSSLTRNWLAYLEEHPKEKVNRYNGFQAIDKFDMGDPANAEKLADYDWFQSQYVSRRKPFLLTNVSMTKDKYTLDHLVDKCGFVDVSGSVKQSMSIGDKSVKDWGGLSKWELPQDIMTDARRGRDDYGNKKWDTGLSLEQFVELYKHMDDIYLHDFGLKTTCSSLFWDETPYDPPAQQYFRIPGVIGRYDLFQKLPRSTYADSWPSLFIGRKGSNSKLHIDSGATGFWMYLISGRKRWIIYDEAERPYLYERIELSSFIADVLSLNATQHTEERTMVHDYFDATYPLLSRANAGNGAYEIVQEANQLVYIPPGSPHAVENLDDIVGISFNQVPRAGIAKYLFEMMHNRRAFGTVEIALRYILSNPDEAFTPLESNPEDPLFVNFGEYVAQ